MPNNEFTFKISLSVLDHLGRNLYRSFATVLGEAISNAWDADAEKVHIYIDKDDNNFYIKDDGVGMTADDFQEKFLKVGYSKRKNGSSISNRNRPFIGRKGIGKLALLSCADKISVISKIAGGEYVGGVIDNSGLNEAITEDLTPQQYPLNEFNIEDFSNLISEHHHGTIIKFENIKGGIKNSLDFLKRIIALYFRFSLLDNSFAIYINDEEITLDHLNDLAEKTQFLWNINNIEDQFIAEKLTNLKEAEIPKSMQGGIKGFIASVDKPSNLKITTTNERASVDLFVNGRIREKDILKHIPTARVAENYFYGQIHFNDLDDNIDRFTSSREGVVADDPIYEEFLDNLRRTVLEIVADWDKLRRRHREDGNPENEDIPKRERKAEELYNTVAEEYELPKGSENKQKMDNLINGLQEDARFNLASYAECFLSENLLREHVEENNLIPQNCLNFDNKNQKTCMDRFDPKVGNTSLCEFCKGKRGKEIFQQQKVDANISITIRTYEDNSLMYLDYIDLTKIIDNGILKDEDKFYKPLRNSVMHTSRLTDEAKTKLTSVVNNIIATIKNIVNEI